MATVDQLDSVLATVEPLVAAVGSDQWDAATPCPGWDVRALLDHLVRGNARYAAALAGQEPPGQDADSLGADPVGAYRDSAAAVVAAFRAPGALDRPVTVPLGTVPGETALHLRIVEVLTHGWDLARATGQSAEFPADVAEQELAFTESALDQLPPDRPFAPPQPVSPDAPAIERLVACLGRSVAAPVQ